MTARDDERSQVPESQKRANEKYQKAHIQQVVVKLDEKSDIDIIRFLDNVQNRQGLIKMLLREEISRVTYDGSREVTVSEATAVEDAQISNRVKKVLNDAGIKQIEELSDLSLYDLWKLRGMGKRCIAELTGYLAEIGVQLRPSEMDEYVK